MRIPKLLLLALVLSATLLPAQVTPPARPNFFGLGPSPDAAAVARGEQLFVAQCGFCHGSTAKGGNGGPDLVRSVLVLHDEGSGTEIGPVIRDGRTAKGMPKFSMTPAEIKDIAAFLLSRSHATIERGGYAIQNVVTGDAKAGFAFFNSNCAACHSPAGDLAHIAGRYDPPTLQTRFLYPRTRISPQAQVTVTVTPRGGAPIAGLLKWIDDFSVGLTDSAGQLHSWLLDDKGGVQVVVRDPLEGHELLLKRYTDADMHNVLAYLVTLK